MKRTELRRTGPPERRTELRRTEMRRGSSREGRTVRTPRGHHAVEFSAKIKWGANVTYGWRCAVALPGCQNQIAQHHHRRLKQQGGYGSLANCLPICAICHRNVHDHPAWATAHGFIVPSWAEPDEVDVVQGCGLACDENHLDQ